jgi:TonB-linked SusC/RagA family outer membrane protein
MKKSLLLFALLLWVGVQTVMAQTKAKGKVFDANGDVVPGASVKVKGTTAGTMTDVDGNFEIDVPEGSQLVISSMGSGETTVDASSNMTVSLGQGSNVLTEVVIAQPYGPPIAKGKYVGAADVITAEQIAKMPVADITKALEGAAPGVQVTNGGGQPGSGSSVRVRGFGSLGGSNAPLIVVDGSPYDGDVTSINPLDVESMTVLKDATATSLYGSRGSNGVIVVTTKRGKRGERPRINVDGKVGTIQRGIPNYNVMTDPKDYYEASWRAQYNSLITGGATPEEAGLAASGLSGQGVVDQLGYNAYTLPGVAADTANAYLLDPVTGKLNPNAQLRYKDDWTKELQRTGFRQDYNLNVSGGSDKTDYYLSAGYLKEKGYILNTDYERFSTRMNVNSQAADWARVGMNLSATMSNQKGLGGSGTSSGNPTFIAQTMAPIYPVYYRDSLNNKVLDPYTGKDKYDYGSLLGDPNFSMGQRATLPGSNVIGQMQLDENSTRVKNITISPYFEAKFLKNFTFRTNLTSNYTNYSTTNYNTSLHGQFVSQGGALTLSNENDFNYTWNQTLSWNKDFGTDHSLSVSAGHENYYFRASYVTGSNTGFPSDKFRDLAVATGTPSSTSNTLDDRIESYFGLFNYGYKGKYLLSGNVRRDGLSRFYKDSRWGTFGAVGAAWIISAEDFMKSVSFVNTLKLKASYGTQGNNGILTGGANNYYAWQGLYDKSRPNGSNTASIPISLINTSLTWETQKQANIGLEFELFKSRLNGELNVYNRQTSGLYYNIPTAPSTGYRSRLDNAATMYNRGIELNLYLTAVKTTNFNWTINAQFSKLTNKITKLAPNQDSFVTGNYMYKPGHSVYDFYIAHSAGVDPNNGDELYSYIAADGSKRDTSDYNYATSNGGRDYRGSAIPDLQGAVTNTFTYKGFSLSFLISYSLGGKYLDGIYQGLMTAGNIGGTNFHEDIKNSWTEANPTASLPRMEYGNQNIAQTSDRFLTNATWVNFRNISLSYSFPENMVKRTGMSSLSAYILADNIGLMSSRKGLNPQSSFSGASDYLYVPSRTIMVGVRVGL